MNKVDKLFTPGPLLTTDSVKQQMLKDYGSRDPQFIKFILSIRQSLSEIVNATQTHTTVLMQGSGTFTVEASLQTIIPRDPSQYKLLIVANGAYGLRQEKVAKCAGFNYELLNYPDNQVIVIDDVIDKLKNDDSINIVSIIHSETTSGLINPVGDLGRAIKQYNSQIIMMVDAMSSFGAHDIDLNRDQIDCIVASSNKCLQGAPGFGYSIIRNELLQKCEGNSRVLSLDLYDQHKAMNTNGQFRFTPPTHIIAAFAKAIEEFNEEGGQPARGKRYSQNQQYLVEEMLKLGFKLYIDQKHQGYIITTFMQPIDQPNWNFNEFYNFLAERNNIIYPGKLTQAESFRIGSIGELYLDDMKELVKDIKEFLETKQIKL